MTSQTPLYIQRLKAEDREYILCEILYEVEKDGRIEDVEKKVFRTLFDLLQVSHEKTTELRQRMRTLIERFPSQDSMNFQLFLSRVYEYLEEKYNRQVLDKVMEELSEISLEIDCVDTALEQLKKERVRESNRFGEMQIVPMKDTDRFIGHAITDYQFHRHQQEQLTILTKKLSGFRTFLWIACLSLGLASLPMITTYSSIVIGLCAIFLGLALWSHTIGQEHLIAGIKREADAKRVIPVNPNLGIQDLNLNQLPKDQLALSERIQNFRRLLNAKRRKFMKAHELEFVTSIKNIPFKEINSTILGGFGALASLGILELLILLGYVFCVLISIGLSGAIFYKVVERVGNKLSDKNSYAINQEKIQVLGEAMQLVCSFLHLNGQTSLVNLDSQLPLDKKELSFAVDQLLQMDLLEEELGIQDGEWFFKLSSRAQLIIDEQVHPGLLEQ